MSDDFIETIWAQFCIETEEHIEGIESLLVKADGETLTAEEISGLFRAFHSLKGLSRVMELTALEAVTHRSEDLLGLVRDGVTGLDKSTVDLLLRGLDAIKGLRELAVTERSDGERPTDLVAQLEAAFRRASGGGDEAADAGGSPADQVSASAAAQASSAASSSAASATGGSAAPMPSAVAQSRPPKEKVVLKPVSDEETQDDQIIFLRLVKNGLPVLEQLASSIAAKHDPQQILSVVQDIKGPLGWMLRASTKLGYVGIESRIEAIRQALPASVDFGQEAGDAVVDSIVGFLSDLRVLSETTGADLGGESLAQVLARLLGESLEQLLNHIESNLELLENADGITDDILADILSQAFSRAHSYLSSLFPDDSCDLPLLYMDAYARAARKQLKLGPSLFGLTRESLTLLKEIVGSSQKKPLRQADVIARLEGLSARAKDYLWANEAGSDEPIDEAKAFVDSLNLPPELAELLSPENSRDLMQAIQEGYEPYLIAAHLESSEELASAFLAWVSERGRVITNRSVFLDDASWYEMLFISRAARPEIEADLQDLDQGEGLIRLGDLAAHQAPAPLSSDVSRAAVPSAPAGAVVHAAQQGASASPVGAAAAGDADQSPAAAASASPSGSAPAPSVAAGAESGAVAAEPPTSSSAPAAAAAGKKPPSSTSQSNVIRVPGEMLDQFMNQIGEMVLVRGQLAHVIADQRIREVALSLRRVADRLPAELAGSTDMQRLLDLVDEQARRLQETDALIQGALSRLQDSVMGLRVVPVELVFKRFPRMVRDLAQAQGKQIRLDLVGQEVKIDKAMVESLADPLLHMVRNSADHGIEPPEERRAAGKPEEATIRITAEQQGSRILIKVSDDGKGIDAERVRRKAVERGLIKEDESHQLSQDEILKFIFRAGFSTAEVVTETSGRGVGMDVVRTNVMRLGGNIHLESELGKGTTFTMQMPLSAAVQEVLLVEASGQTLAIPGRYVAEVVEINADEVQTVKGREALLLRGNFLPIVRLDHLLGFPVRASGKSPSIVVLSDGQRTLGVSVDEFLGRQELFTKDIHPRLAALPGVGGASILGDGRVVLILDGAAIYRLAESYQPPSKLSLAA